MEKMIISTKEDKKTIDKKEGQNKYKIKKENNNKYNNFNIKLAELILKLKYNTSVIFCSTQYY